jgi:hypothetical protein
MIISYLGYTLVVSFVAIFLVIDIFKHFKQCFRVCGMLLYIQNSFADWKDFCFVIRIRMRILYIHIFYDAHHSKKFPINCVIVSSTA